MTSSEGDTTRSPSKDLLRSDDSASHCCTQRSGAGGYTPQHDNEEEDNDEIRSDAPEYIIPTPEFKDADTVAIFIGDSPKLYHGNLPVRGASTDERDGAIHGLKQEMHADFAERFMLSNYHHQEDLCQQVDDQAKNAHCKDSCEQINQASMLSVSPPQLPLQSVHNRHKSKKRGREECSVDNGKGKARYITPSPPLSENEEQEMDPETSEISAAQSAASAGETDYISECEEVDGDGDNHYNFGASMHPSRRRVIVRKRALHAEQISSNALQMRNMSGAATPQGSPFVESEDPGRRSLWPIWLHPAFHVESSRYMEGLSGKALNK